MCNSVPEGGFEHNFFYFLYFFPQYTFSLGGVGEVSNTQQGNKHPGSFSFRIDRHRQVYTLETINMNTSVRPVLTPPLSPV